MLGRLFWFLLGAGLAIWVFLKIRSMLRQASPKRSHLRSPTPRPGSAPRRAASPTGFELPWPSAKRNSVTSSA